MSKLWSFMDCDKDLVNIANENASLTECYDFQVLKAEPQECLMSFALK